MNKTNVYFLCCVAYQYYNYYTVLQYTDTEAINDFSNKHNICFFYRYYEQNHNKAFSHHTWNW